MKSPGSPAPPSRERHAGATRGILFILASTVFFAVLDSLSKYLVRDYPVAGVVWVRYAVPLLLLSVVFGPRMGKKLIYSSCVGVQMLRGLLLTGTTLAMVLSLRVLPIAETEAISFTAPLLLTAMAAKLLGEHVRRSAWAAVIAGFFGVLIIIRPGGGVFSAAVVLPLGAAVFYALYQLATRHVAGREDALTSLFYAMLVGTVIMSLTLPWLWVTPNLKQMALLLIVGLLAGAGHFCVIKAFMVAPASRLAPFIYAQLVWVSIIGSAMFGEFPGALNLLGMTVIAGSGLLVVFRK
jgi:drug/metabolite transporter (DMT)-like permease